MVDEGSRAAGTGSVHPLFYCISKIGNLCVLSAKLYYHIGLRYEFLHRKGAGNNLLLEFCADFVREGKASGACNYRAYRDVAFFR